MKSAFSSMFGIILLLCMYKDKNCCAFSAFFIVLFCIMYDVCTMSNAMQIKTLFDLSDFCFVVKTLFGYCVYVTLNANMQSVFYFDMISYGTTMLHNSSTRLSTFCG